MAEIRSGSSSPLSVLSRSPSPPDSVFVPKERAPAKRASPRDDADREPESARKRPRRSSGRVLGRSAKSQTLSTPQKVTSNPRRSTRSKNSPAATSSPSTASHKYINENSRPGSVSGEQRLSPRNDTIALVYLNATSNHLTDTNPNADDANNSNAPGTVSSKNDSTEPDAEANDELPPRRSDEDQKADKTETGSATTDPVTKQNPDVAIDLPSVEAFSHVEVSTPSLKSDPDAGGIEHVTPVVNSSSRSRRRRKDAVSYEEKEDGTEDELEGPTPAKPAAARTAKKRQPLRGNWSADFLTQNPKSKITQINLQALLSHDKAWSALTQTQKIHLISLLPAQASVLEFSEDDEIPNLPREYLKTNSAMQSDVSSYKDELAAGWYDPVWLEQAAEAMERRAAGKYDSWKEKNREEFWGQKQRIDWNATAGESAEHTLSNLVRDGCFEVGDVWKMDRRWGRGADAVAVIKEATVTGVTGERLAFSFPPAQHISSAPTNGEDISIADVTGPKQLSDAMLREDGRIPRTVRGPNSWKEFRVFRKNMDIGGLWDVRELYHHRQLKQ